MVRLKDVAEQAGVSIGTASKVLNGSRADLAFSADCVRRVRRAARELGYAPNYLARGLQTGRSYALGMALGALGRNAWSDFWSQMLGGMVGQAHALGYHCITIGAEDGPSSVHKGLRFLRERRVDGLIVPGFACPSQVPLELLEPAGPVVLINFFHETSLPSVELDGASGMAAAVRHLRDLGHRRLLWIGQPAERHPSSEERRGAFWSAVREGGLEGEEVVLPVIPAAYEEVLPDVIAGSCAELLERWRGGLGATGLICYDEGIAFGAYAALAQMGLRVPQDVSVVGFDDIYAHVAWPPMTVVSHMLGQMGSAAAEMAVQMAEDEPDAAPDAGLRRRIPAELVVRKSTGPAPA